MMKKGEDEKLLRESLLGGEENEVVARPCGTPGQIGSLCDASDVLNRVIDYLSVECLFGA